MECPAEMAISFLRKWHEENTVLVVALASPRLHLSMGGSVTAFDAGGVEISAIAVKAPSGEVTAAPGALTVSFEDATFEYSEPRESGDKAFEVMFVCLLQVRSLLPNGEPDFVLTLTEMREQPDKIHPIGS